MSRPEYRRISHLTHPSPVSKELDFPESIDEQIIRNEKNRTIRILAVASKGLSSGDKKPSSFLYKDIAPIFAYAGQYAATESVTQDYKMDDEGVWDIRFTKGSFRRIQTVTYRDVNSLSPTHQPNLDVNLSGDVVGRNASRMATMLMLKIRDKKFGSITIEGYLYQTSRGERLEIKAASPRFSFTAGGEDPFIGRLQRTFDVVEEEGLTTARINIDDLPRR